VGEQYVVTLYLVSSTEAREVTGRGMIQWHLFKHQWL